MVLNFYPPDACDFLNRLVGRRTFEPSFQPSLQLSHRRTVNKRGRAFRPGCRSAVPQTRETSVRHHASRETAIAGLL